MPSWHGGRLALLVLWVIAVVFLPGAGVPAAHTVVGVAPQTAGYVYDNQIRQQSDDDGSLDRSPRLGGGQSRVTASQAAIATGPAVGPSAPTAGSASVRSMYDHGAQLLRPTHGAEGRQDAVRDAGEAFLSSRWLSVATKGGANAVRVGQAGESAVRSAFDVGPKATRVVDGRTRIFDGLNDVAVSEVKNVKYQAYTQQLKDSLAYAQQNGLRFDLYVRGGANPTTLSGPLEAAIRNGDIGLRYIP